MLYSFLIYQYNIDAIIILLGTFIIYGAFVATEIFGIHKKIHFPLHNSSTFENGIAIVLVSYSGFLQPYFFQNGRWK